MTDSVVTDTTVSEHALFPSRFEFISFGANGYVYKAENNVALKHAKSDSDEEIRDNFAREKFVYEIFEKHEWASPYILQSLFRGTNAIFMMYMPGETLEHRIRANQEFDDRGRLLQVRRLEPKAKVERWCVELASAISFLETLSLAHGDLRPANILLDGEDHIKLTDFDSVAPFGSEFSGGSPPWWRNLGPEGGSQQGTTGDLGVRTESFGYGSIVYTISRGHEPYEFDEDETAIVDKFQTMIFPDLSEDPVDAIIGKCWNNSYISLKELESEASSLFGIEPAACVHRSQDPLLEPLRDWCREINNTVHLTDSCVGTRKTLHGYECPPEVCIEQHDGGAGGHE